MKGLGRFALIVLAGGVGGALATFLAMYFRLAPSLHTPIAAVVAVGSGLAARSLTAPAT